MNRYLFAMLAALATAMLLTLGTTSPGPQAAGNNGGGGVGPAVAAPHDPYMAKFAPKSSLIYVECPDIGGMLTRFRNTQAIDGEQWDAMPLIEHFTKNVELAFGLSSEEAEELVGSLQGVSFSLCLEENDNDLMPLVQMHFKSPDAAKKLLVSRRFGEHEDQFFPGGTNYIMARQSVDELEEALPEPDKEFESEAEERAYTSKYMTAFMLTDLSFSSRREAMVFFEDQGVLAIGDSGAVLQTAHTLEGTKSSLIDQEHYTSASRQWAYNADVVALGAPFVFLNNSEIIDRSDGISSKIVSGYFADERSFSSTLRMDRQGLLTKTKGSVQGDMLPPAEMIVESVPLNLAGRLPKTTMAYLAGQVPSWSLSELRGEVRDYLLEMGIYFDNAREMNRANEDWQEAWAESFVPSLDIWDQPLAQGNFALALLCDPSEDFGYMLDDPDAAKEFKDTRLAFALAIEMSDDQYRRQLASIEEALETLSDDDIYEPEDENAPLVLKKESELNRSFELRMGKEVFWTGRIRRMGTYAIIGIGASSLLDGFEASIKGTEPGLRGDIAWQQARMTVGDEGVLENYCDTGRLLWMLERVAADERSERSLRIVHDVRGVLGVPFELIENQGDERMVSMSVVGIRGNKEKTSYDVTINDLNAAPAATALLLINRYSEDLMEVTSPLAMAAEAESTIGSLKRHLEVYFVEMGSNAPDVAALEAAGYVYSGGYSGKHYDTFTWTGGIENGRFVGTITGTPRVSSAAPLVEIEYKADGTANITRILFEHSSDDGEGDAEEEGEADDNATDSGTTAEADAESADAESDPATEESADQSDEGSDDDSSESDGDESGE